MLKTGMTEVAEMVERKECRFYLFVRWKNGARKYGDPTSNYNGDKFDKEDLRQQLINLIRIFLKFHPKMAVALLYDSSIPKYQPDRDILKLCNGVIELNRLKEYPLLNDFPLPDMLRELWYQQQYYYQHRCVTHLYFL